MIGVLELGRATKGWVPPGQKAGQRLFQLNEDYVPGDLDYDPLGIKPEGKDFDIMQTRELNNGRLAMFAILGEIAQEFVTGKELYNLKVDALLNPACDDSTGVICDILEKSG